jgi:hypothetical protein
MTKEHQSDSSEQQAAESYLLGALEERLGIAFNANASFHIDIGVRPDGIDPENKVVAEVYARVGELKGAQLHKVKADILKLAFIERKLGNGWRKIICFGSADAAKFLLGKSWAAEAARAFGIEVFVEPLPKEQEDLVKAAQYRQRMVNPES